MNVTAECINDTSVEYGYFPVKTLNLYSPSLQYTLYKGVPYYLGSLASMYLDINFPDLMNYDAVFLLGNPVTKYKVTHPTYKYKEVAICEDNAEVIHVVTSFRAIPVGYLYDENQTKLYRTCYPEYVEETLKDMTISKDANVLILPMRVDDGYEILTKQAIKSTIQQLNKYANEI